MAQEQLYEANETAYDTENYSLSDGKLVTDRFDDEEEDELTRKIKAIPILPRIPKIKKTTNAGDEDANKRVLEHRSVLHRKEFFMNSDDALKWPKTEVQTHERQRKKKHDFNSYKRFNRDQSNDSEINHFNKTNNKRVSCENLSKSMSAEEKFDQLISKKDSENTLVISANNSEDSKCSSGSSERISSEFECFENSLLNNIPVKPYKTLEERRQERMSKGLFQPSLNSISNENQSSILRTSSNVNSDLLSQWTGCDEVNILGASTTSTDDTQKPEDGWLDICQTSSSGFTNPGDASQTSNPSSTCDSQTEVIDMDIGNSPCDDVNVSGTTTKTRKVTFNCPEVNESAKASNFASKKQSKKKPENNKKCNSQDQVVSIMKDFLKPYYSKQKITKDEYKEIMRKVVPKFSKNNKEEIKKEKIEHYADKYVRMYIHKKKA